jgi:hypothetical protein
MPESNTTCPRSPNQWERKCILFEYEVATPISGLSPIPDLYTVRFACGWGGTGATETAALCDGVRTVRFFKGSSWIDALTQRFDEMPGNEGAFQRTSH